MSKERFVVYQQKACQRETIIHIDSFLETKRVKVVTFFVVNYCLNL